MADSMDPVRWTLFSAARQLRFITPNWACCWSLSGGIETDLSGFGGRCLLPDMSLGTFYICLDFADGRQPVGVMEIDEWDKDEWRHSRSLVGGDADVWCTM